MAPSGSRVRQQLTRIIDVFSDIGGGAAAIAIVLILILVCAEVAGRALFSISILIAEEMGGYLNAAVIFLGGAYTLKEGGFIRVDILYGRLRGALKATVARIVAAISLGYVTLLIYMFWGQLRWNYEMGIVSPQISATPLYIPQIAVLAGAVLLALQLLALLLGRAPRDRTVDE